LIEKALNELSTMQMSTFDHSFPKKEKDAPVAEGSIILGGGAGFVGKSMLYSLQEEKQRIAKIVQFLMEKQIPKHKHFQDEDKGISPRMQKTTKFADRSWMMGRCKITFENL
jgi:CRISPR-associated protein Csm5